MPNKSDDKKVSFATKTATLLENVVIMLIAVVGMIVSFTATWGGGSRAAHAGVFPQLLFVFVGIGAVCMFFSNVKYEEPPKNYNIPLLFAAAFSAWVGLYFWCAMNLGFVVSTLLFLLITITVFTPDPKAHYKGILLASGLSTFIIWGVFVKIIGIVLPQALLF